MSIRSSRKGTTFRIFLPRHVASAQEIAAERAAEAEAPAIADALAAADQVKRAGQRRSHRRGHDPAGRGRGGLACSSMPAGLTSRGYTVLEAGNGVEAIDVLEKSDGKVDLVVSDVVMPEMDGPTLLRELRSRNPGMKIIFVSGYAEDAFQKHLPDRRQPIRLPGKAVHAQAARRRGEGDAGGLRRGRPHTVRSRARNSDHLDRTSSTPRCARVRHARVRRFATGHPHRS